MTGNDTSGDGLSHATAWKTVQKALNVISQDATNGDRININDEGDDVLSAPLNIDGGGKYGSPTTSAPLILQGYTTTPGDGGIGGMDGALDNIIFDSAVNAVHIVDMHLHHTGANTIIQLGDSCRLFNVELDDSTTNGCLLFGANSSVINCHFHNIAKVGVGIENGIVANCFFKDGTNAFETAIRHQDGTPTGPALILNNVISLKSSVATSDDGIQYNDHSIIIGNTIFSASGASTGIGPFDTANKPIAILNNYVEGFNRTGGIGIEISADDKLSLYGNNYLFKNKTEEDVSGDVFLNIGNNTILSVSALADPANDDFTVDTSVKAKGFPTIFKGTNTSQFLDIGAAQRVEKSSAGRGLIHAKGGLL